jgi:ATP-binding cassette, subfamily C, bacterial exporter for protease/lipase
MSNVRDSWLGFTPLRLVWQDRQSAIVLLVASALVNLLYLTPAIYMLQVYDRVLLSQSTSTLLALSGLAFFLLVLVGVLEGIRGATVAKLGEAVEHGKAMAVYRAAFFRQLKSANDRPSQPVSDLQAIRVAFSSHAVVALLDLPWLPIFLAVLFFLHPVLGWFGVLGVILVAITSLLAERSTRELSDESSGATGAAFSVANEQLRSAESVFALGLFPGLSRRWNSLQQRALSRHWRAASKTSLTSGAMRAIRLCVQSGMLGVGAFLAIQGQVSPGVMIAAVILSARAMSPLEALLSQWRSLRQGLLGLRRIDALLREFPQAASLWPHSRPTGLITAENVFVSVPGREGFVVKGLTFRVGPGESIAISGPAGSGKSALIKALLGVWPVVLGKLRIDGMDVRNWQHEEGKGVIGYLPQDFALFDGTVAENISGFSDSDTQGVQEAAAMSGARASIVLLPKAYDTVTGSTGQGLSPGQRQLVGLARALYKQPQIVVLDDPSAHLDAAGRAGLLETLDRLHALKATVVVVSNDPQVLRQVDRVLVLEEGQIRRIYAPRKAMSKAGEAA